MNEFELALHYQHLELRTESVAEGAARLRRRVESDPESDRLAAELAGLRERLAPLESLLAERDREAGSHRQRLRSRERELMSGHISNPAELVKLAAEVDHMKSALADEEERELELISQTEDLEGEIAQAQTRLDEQRRLTAAAGPDLERDLALQMAEIEALERARDAAWKEVPAALQGQYRRLKSRVRDPVAEVVDAKCQACRVQVTSNAMQVLRRGAPVTCDNCDRLLVLA